MSKLISTADKRKYSLKTSSSAIVVSKDLSSASRRKIEKSPSSSRSMSAFSSQKLSSKSAHKK